MRAAQRILSPKTLSPLILSACIAVAAVTSAGAAEAPSRPEYVSRLEAICKPRSEATERAVKGVRADIRAERLRVAAAKFSRAEHIFGATIDLIAKVPQPSADAKTLTTWFGYLGREKSYLGKTAAALHAGQTIASQHYTASFVHEGNLANDAVLEFGFNYCSFKLSRYV